MSTEGKLIRQYAIRLVFVVWSISLISLAVLVPAEELYPSLRGVLAAVTMVTIIVGFILWKTARSARKSET